MPDRSHPHWESLSVLLIFLDGVGVAPATPHNPLRHALPGLEAIAGGPWVQGLATRDEPHRCVRTIDANLGIDGLPQSGTGQATLFTGVNCAAIAGRHYGPYPHSATRQTIAEKNIFSRVRRAFDKESEPAAFANAFPDRFFALSARRDWWTVTTRCCLDAGIRIRTAEDLAKGNAISADITGSGWPQADPIVEPVSELDAAARLLRLSRHHRFTLFEYYLTDKAGHSQNHDRAVRVLKSVDRLIGGILAGIDTNRDLVLVTSDHGNLEDLSTKSHTRNPVPLIAYGRHADALSDVDDLTGIVPAIMDVLTRKR